MQPILVPGAHVLRRDADTLQVGLGAPRVLLPDTPRHRRLVQDPPRDLTLTRLGGLALPDDAALRAALPPDRDDDDTVWARHSLASRARHGTLPHPADTPEVHVTVRSYGGRLGGCLADDLRRVLCREGLTAPARRRCGPRSAHPREVHVLVGVGEPAREHADEWLEAGTPHLFVRFVEGRAVVGPTVVPGASACLRCLDLHTAEHDPAWPLLLEQYSRLTRQDRPDGVPEPVDAAAASVALGWAAREVTALVSGGAPLTTSRTLTISADLVEVALTEWPLREDCGCG